jgi:hypothetical protein
LELHFQVLRRCVREWSGRAWRVQRNRTVLARCATQVRCFAFRRLRIQGDQGRGRVRIQVHCKSKPLLLVLRFYCYL